MLDNNGAMHTSLSNERFCTAKVVISIEFTKVFSELFYFVSCW